MLLLWVKDKNLESVENLAWERYSSLDPVQMGVSRPNRPFLTLVDGRKDTVMSLNRNGFVKRAAAAAMSIAMACPEMVSGASADETTQPANSAAAAKIPKPMKMDQPMAGEMKKEGMTKGDVQKAAQKKQHVMKDVMEKEEKAMAREPVKK